MGSFSLIAKYPVQKVKVNRVQIFKKTLAASPKHQNIPNTQKPTQNPKSIKQATLPLWNQIGLSMEIFWIPWKYILYDCNIDILIQKTHTFPCLQRMSDSTSPEWPWVLGKV